MGSINIFSFFHKLPTDVDSPFPDTTALQLKQRKGKSHPFLHASAVTGIAQLVLCEINPLHERGAGAVHPIHQEWDKRKSNNNHQSQKRRS